MADRDKVVKGLEYCIADDFCDGCPYECDCFADDTVAYAPLMRDALAMIKEMEHEIDVLESLRRIEREGR